MNLQENILRIKQIMGLLNEQTNGNLLTDKQYDYIKDIEHKFSYIEKDKITPGLQYTGRDKESQIKNTIEKTIGLDYWNKLNAKLKLQIYSFMYQTDSANNSLYRWLSGLATTIIQYKNEKNPDKNTQIPIMKRSDIFTTTTTITGSNGKTTTKILPLDELEEDKRNNIKKAIKIVKEAIDDGTINTINFYNLYLNTIKDQYNNISTGPTTDKNRKYIWGPRPDALDKLMNGNPWSNNVEKWWWDTIDPKKELEENPYKTTGGSIQTATTTKDSAQTQTTGGETSTNPAQTTPPTQTNPTQTTGGAIQQTNTSSLTVQDKLKNNQTLTKEELNFKGDLNLDNSNVTSLPEGLQVDGSLSLNNCYNLTSLPKNLDVTGNLDLLGTTKLTSLPEGLAVWGFIQIKDSTLARIYTNDDLREMVGSNGNLSYINRNSLRPLSDIIATDSPSNTIGTQTPTQQTPTQTTPKPHPSIDNPFTPTNGDPWKYAYDGTKLIVKSPTTGNEYNLLYPETEYKANYPGSKLKTQADLNKAIASIKTAYGDKLGM